MNGESSPSLMHTKGGLKTRKASPPDITPALHQDPRIMSGWFTGLGMALESVKQQAIKLGEEAVQTAQQLKDEAVIQAQALKVEAVQTANALRDAALEANKEILEEQEKIKASLDPTLAADHVVTILPWEAEDEAKSILSQPLMEQISALSLNEDNFAPLGEEKAAFAFKLENYVQVAMKVLEIDPNLQKMHAKFGARVAEEEFWRSYFFRCACLRAEIGMGAGKEYQITGDAVALAKLSRPAVSTSSGGGAAAVVSEAADSLAGLSLASPTKRPPPAGGDSSTTPSSGPKSAGQGEGKKDEAAGDEAVDEELELEGLEDDLGDLEDVDDQDMDELDAEIAKELGDL